MGCFLACFGGASKNRRRRKPGIGTPTREWVRVQESYKPLRRSVSPKRPASELAINSFPELREKNEERFKEKSEEGSSSGDRKKVTFDLNVKTIAEVPAQDDDADYSSENNRERKEIDQERKPPGGDGEGKSSPGANIFPPSHRYRNCASSDDEESEFGGDGNEDEYEDCDFDDDDEAVDNGGDEEESYESYFSLPLEKEKENFKEVNSPKPITAASPDREPTVLAIQNARDRSQYVHSVLNPVENLSQWREAKTRAAQAKHPKKENLNSEQEAKLAIGSEPTFKIQKAPKLCDSSTRSKNSTKHEVSVDASLSSWLATPQASESRQTNSSLSREERPILGALTVEDLKQSVTSSPRRSPSRSPDEMPIVGTVGTHWNSKNQACDSDSSQSGSVVKGIPTTSSKYREDRRVNWHSTPFEVRLEKALNRGTLEASPSSPLSGLRD